MSGLWGRVIQFVTGVLVCSLQLVHADELFIGNGTQASRFERYFEDALVKNVPGAALVILTDKDQTIIRTYGVKSLENPDKITQETVFRLASVSKTFASAATAKLINNTDLSWDTPIISQLGFLKFKNPGYGDRITLRNVLSQSTGLVPHAYTNLVEDNVSYEKILNRLNKVDFVCPPGKCYTYQNVVYSLVGDIVEIRTSKSYEDYVNETLFQPLDMQHASFGLNAFLESDSYAIPHIRKNRQWAPVKSISKNYYTIAPAAGVNASISDLTKWLQAQLGRRVDVLPEQTLQQLHSRITPVNGYQSHYGKREKLGDAFYGLGWRVFDYAGQSGFVHHGGWVQGMRAEMVFNRDLQIGMAFLVNAEANDLGDVVFEFLDTFVSGGQSIKTALFE